MRRRVVRSFPSRLVRDCGRSLHTAQVSTVSTSKQGARITSPAPAAPPVNDLGTDRAATPSRPAQCSRRAWGRLRRRRHDMRDHVTLHRREHSSIASLPDDGHQAGPHEEAWLLVDEEKQPDSPQGHVHGIPKQRMLQMMGLEVSPELVAISMVYFVQGILGLSRLAMSFFLKDELHIGPAEVAVLTGLAGLPWMVKPLYGFISDTVPLWGYRRRSYLVVCGLMGSLSWLAFATVVRSPLGAASALLLSSLSTAASDVVVDSLVVERARGEPQSTAGSLQSLCWASSAVGGILSAYASGSLVQSQGTHFVFGLTAVFPLIVSISALLIDEQRVGSGAGPSTPLSPGASSSSVKYSSLPTHTSSSKAAAAAAAAAGGGGGVPGMQSMPPSGTWAALQARVLTQSAALWAAVSQKQILLPTVFVFLWQATPTADSAMFYYYTNQLHFDAEFLGRVRLAGSVASLAGVALYNTKFKKVPLRRMLFWSMILGTVLGSTQLLLISGASRTLGLSDQLFVLGDSVVLTVLGQVSFMPILVLAARLCPEGVEATLFATLMSILNGGSFVGSALGAGLTATLGVSADNFDQLFTLVALCTISTLLPAPFLNLLPPDVDQEPPGSGGANSNENTAAAAAAAAAATGNNSSASSSGGLPGAVALELRPAGSSALASSKDTQ